MIRANCFFSVNGRNTIPAPEPVFAFQRVATANCAAQTWPNIPHGCLTSADGRPVRQAARMITVEDRREGERTSVLVRLPAVDVARR